MPEAIQTTTEQDGKPPKLSVERNASALVIRLGGEWRLTRDLPSLTPVIRELESGRPRKVAFDSSELSGWDSSLLVLIDKIDQLCKEHSIEEDTSGLPDGVTR